jgi:hypothetical protein
MRKLTLILMGSGVILGGCSQSTTSSNTSDSTSENTTISKVKSMFSSKKNTTTQEVNLAVLISKSLSDIATSNSGNRATAVKLPYGFTLTAYFLDPDLFKKEMLAAYKNKALNTKESDLEEMKKTLPISMYNVINAQHEAALKNDDNTIWKGAVQLIGLNLIAEANQACGNGWYTGVGNPKKVLNEELAIYENIRFANDIETLIAEKIKDKSYDSEANASKDIINIYFEINPEKLYNILLNINVDGNKEHYTADFTGKSDGVAFGTNKGYFICDSSGTSWQQNNTSWFGSGNLSGQKYTAKVEYSTGAEMAKTKKMDLNSTTENSNANSADNAVKSK